MIKNNFLQIKKLMINPKIILNIIYDINMVNNIGINN
jgi:hypothetical protein